MNDEARNPQDSNQTAGINTPATGSDTPEQTSFYRVPAPPVPGKIAWSLSPWLPE